MIEENKTSMKLDVKNRFTGAVQFTAEIECDESAEKSVKLGLAVKWGFKASANLNGANLDGANLNGANLNGASLYRASLNGANLNGANLNGANLNGANLNGANLDGASLDGASLYRASLYRASLNGANLNGANLNGAKLIGKRPIIQIGPIGSRSSYLIGFIADTGILIKSGCFDGTLSEFVESVKKTHGDNEHGVEYASAIEMIQAHYKLWRPQ